LDPNTRKIACGKVKKIILGITEALGAKANLNIIPSYPSLINDISMTGMVKSVAEELLGKENVIVIDIDEDALPIAAAMYAEIALKFLTD